MTTPDEILWQPIADLEAAHRRARLMQRAREFFAARNVLEIDTPVLGEATVSDPCIESISVELELSPGRHFYLQTSPEFHMKRLLAAGFPDMYEIGKVFRDGELGRNHQSEFTMVEWYRLGFGLNDIIQDTIDFIEALVDSARIVCKPDRMTYRDAFRRYADIDPMLTNVDEISNFLDADQDLKSSIGDSVDAGLDLLMATRIATQFAADRLTIVYHYPASQAALAQICPDDAAVADRFEVFFGSLELANGYVELSDAEELRRRCAEDQDKRRANHSAVRPIDKKFMASLQSGLPACAGVAAGFDRLMMVHTGADDIRQVLHFPIEN